MEIRESITNVEKSIEDTSGAAMRRRRRRRRYHGVTAGATLKTTWF